MTIFSYYHSGLQLRNIMIEKIAEMYPQAADLKLQITNKIRLRNCGIAVADQVFPPRGGIAIADLKKSSASHLCYSEDSQVQFRSSYWLIHFSGLHTTVLKGCRQSLPACQKCFCEKSRKECS